MASCFFAMSASLLAVGIAGEAAPLMAAAFLLVSAFFCISLDAVGSAAFMRAVRPWERPQMAAVYRTYLDLSDLLRSDANMPQAVVVPSCPNLEIVPAGPDGARMPPGAFVR